jgi:hypothetical protein
VTDLEEVHLQSKKQKDGLLEEKTIKWPCYYLASPASIKYILIIRAAYVCHSAVYSLPPTASLNPSLTPVCSVPRHFLPFPYSIRSEN